MAEPHSKKDVDQLQLEHDATQPIPATTAGANIVQNPLKVREMHRKRGRETNADVTATR